MFDDLVEVITEVRNEGVSQRHKENKVSWRKSLDIKSHNFPRPHQSHDYGLLPAFLSPNFHSYIHIGKGGFES